MGLAFDASSLILLEEIGLVSSVLRLGIDLVTTGAVIDEVHSLALRTIAKGGKIRIASARERSLPSELRLGLGPGEISIIEFVVETPGFWAVLDERRARAVAQSFGIRYLGTARIVKHLADRGILGKAEARGLLESLPSHGFYIERSVIEEIFREPMLDLE